MRVGFGAIVPFPITWRSTVRYLMTNLQSVRRQVNQDIIPFACDEAVFCIVVDIMMSEPGVFDDLFPLLGMFHYQKVLLRCAGRYLTGSGMDYALIESSVFGPKTLNTVMSASHYVCALSGMLIVSEVLETMMFESFWEAHQEDELSAIQDVAYDLRDALTDKSREHSISKLQELLENTDVLRAKMEAYLTECEQKSELCKFFRNFLTIVSVIKKAIAADRNGNWALHVGAVGESMKILAEFDAYRYLRNGSWYHERIKVLEKTQPSLFRRFQMGYFVVRDRVGAYFSAVAGDLKLEQSINRFSNGPGAPATVGKSGDDIALTEFALLFHQILEITSLLQSITSPKLMDHSETNIRHDITGKTGYIFDENIKRLFDFVKARVNPFNIPVLDVPPVPLYNFVTNLKVNEVFSIRILNVMENGEKVHKALRQERFIEKKVKLTDTIHRQNLPSFM